LGGGATGEAEVKMDADRSKRARVEARNIVKVVK
jgi:hypothetical protein